jgi:hypothetical protein
MFKPSVTKQMSNSFDRAVISDATELHCSARILPGSISRFAQGVQNADWRVGRVSHGSRRPNCGVPTPGVAPSTGRADLYWMGPPVTSSCSGSPMMRTTRRRHVIAECSSVATMFERQLSSNLSQKGFSTARNERRIRKLPSQKGGAKGATLEPGYG